MTAGIDSDTHFLFGHQYKKQNENETLSIWEMI